MNHPEYHSTGSALRRLAAALLVPGLLLLVIRPIPVAGAVTATWLQGVVIHGATGQPVVGARITVNGIRTWTTAGGVYGMAVNPPGSYPVSCSKPGFDNYSSPPLLFTSGGTVVHNISLLETLHPPDTVNAWLDTVPAVVPVTWEPPSGEYELLYDDGIQDNFTVWSAQGNMNALRFTPPGYPARVTGGLIHIGTWANYPLGSNPLVSFQVRLFDATGPSGCPGNSLSEPVTVTPAAPGWIEFTLPSPVGIGSGSFYIAMVQGGNAPQAAGIAIDESTPQWRSWSRFVTGGSAWFPAGGNFMIRARCDGPGGPVLLADLPDNAISFSIFRLRQGEEQNPTAWISLGSAPAPPVTDSSWASLPCGPYRWGVKAAYPGNRWSAPAFSNVVGKCWTAPVTLHLALSCDTLSAAGSQVRMINLAYPDTVYAATADSTGIITFPSVWKGSYHLTATRFGFDTLALTLPVAAPVTQSLFLLQVRMPPANLEVDDSSLVARWDVPRFDTPLFTETWSSGSFATNGWTAEGGNWAISPSLGYPAPSAVFGAIPQQTAYSLSLTSRTITGPNSTLLKMSYDIFLDNYGTTTVNTMAAEIWDGAAWNVLNTYSSSGGDMPWTHEEIDISAYSGLAFRIRFRAAGGDTYDISNWNLDNIEVTATEPAQVQATCILGYYFYLGNSIIGYTTKNAFPIPGNLVQYGQTYSACVRALYGSGYSDFSCTTFTSAYLCPVRELTGVPSENSAILSWLQPVESDTSTSPPPGLTGYRITRNDSVIAVINDPDSLNFCDYGLEPGYYRYGVSARYDLASYGYPGQSGESLPAGPVHVAITWGRQLPFFEAWNAGNFAFNEWRFSPAQGNWMIDPNEGLPSPAACFRWQPPMVAYDCALESPSFNGLPFNCAALWLDFDLKLNDRNHTGTEKLAVEVYYNNIWHRKAEFSNTGSKEWTNYHLDISPARGKGFRIRFRATGQNSSDILNWCLDNVSVYAVCYPATGLTASPAGNAVTLNWSPPACYGGNILNEGFEGEEFPPAQWSRQTSNPAAAWSHQPASSPPGVHHGSYSASLNWDYNHQDEWLIAHDIYVNGDLTFWSYAFQGSTHLDHYYIMASSDNGITWNILMDLSALPAYPSANGINAWETPYHVDLSMYDGETVDLAWRAVDGDGNGLWYPWAIDDCSIGADDRPEVVTGYDIFRKHAGGGGFVKVNMEPVTDTTWTDTGLIAGLYYYYVQVQFDECSSSTPSDTVTVDVITGTGRTPEGDLRIFPNPAVNRLIVRSFSPVREVVLSDVAGRPVETWVTGSAGQVVLDVAHLPRGFYLLRVRTDKGVMTGKICLKSD